MAMIGADIPPRPSGMAGALAAGASSSVAKVKPDCVVMVSMVPRSVGQRWADGLCAEALNNR
jgi:hypothetical protein